jgi:transposase
MFETLTEQGAVKRRRRGRPPMQPKRVVGGKGYSARRIRAYARRRGMRITMPRCSNEPRRGPFDKTIYRQRNRVERLIGRMKQYRRLATRYEKRAANYRAMWVIAPTILWLSLQTRPSLHRIIAVLLGQIQISKDLRDTPISQVHHLVPNRPQDNVDPRLVPLPPG